MPEKIPISILGASVRAAAHSARRAGHSVWGRDLFADVDLLAAADAQSIQRYPVEFLAALSCSPTRPWIYTGALENYPGLLARLAKIRPLWGNAASVARSVRNLSLLGEVLRSAKIPFPETVPVKQLCAGQTQTHGQRWLYKPRRTGGGLRICLLDSLDQAVDPFASQSRGYLQKFIPGTACSAVYVAGGGRAVLVGLTNQLIGQASLAGGGFAYCGSTGPVALSAHQKAELTRIGAALAKHFQLVGLFGVDLIQADSTEVSGSEYTVIEVNPRYTASVELLERAYNIHTIPWHLAACATGQLPCAAELASLRANSWHIKGILYARREARFHAELAEYVRKQNASPHAGQLADWPRIADIPATGTIFQPGMPIVTLFASGVDSTVAEQHLNRSICQIESLLYGQAAPGDR